MFIVSVGTLEMFGFHQLEIQGELWKVRKMVQHSESSLSDWEFCGARRGTPCAYLHGPSILSTNIVRFGCEKYRLGKFNLVMKHFSGKVVSGFETAFEILLSKLRNAHINI